MDQTGGGDDAAALRRMTVGELKSLLRARGVNFADCIEKEDLINRALESGAAGLGVEEPKNQQTPPASSVFKVTERKENLGGLDTIVIENNPQPETLVVICHGFGANNLDLASIGHEALGVLGKEQKVRFLFPNAPLSLGGESRAWWHIDIHRLMTKMFQGPSGIEEVTREVPDGIDNARTMLTKLVNQARSQFPQKLPMSRVLVGGFSQGSMLATDYTLHCEPEELPGGLAVFSGSLICADRWRSLATSIKERRGSNALRVLQTHGTQDPILPYALSTQLQNLFTSVGGFSVTFEKFTGGHTIPPTALRKFIDLLRLIK